MPTALPATERGRRTRALIIDSAAALMYQRGVNATSLDDVLAAAGSGKSQMYHYFDGKADLVAAVIDRQLEFVLSTQRTALDGADSWEGIDAWAAHVVAMHSLPGGPFACPLGTIATELMNDDAYRPALDAAFRQWEAPLARGLRAMKDRGELVGDADPHRLAAMVIAALQGGILLARLRGDVGVLRDVLEGAVARLRESHRAN
jgi:TetR/AcrR family transcriptional repressor of nem operon